MKIIEITSKNQLIIELYDIDFSVITSINNALEHKDIFKTLDVQQLKYVLNDLYSMKKYAIEVLKNLNLILDQTDPDILKLKNIITNSIKELEIVINELDR